MRFWPAAATAARPSLSESGPMKRSSRSSTRIFPVRTYFLSTVGKTFRWYSAQNGHWKWGNPALGAGALGGAGGVPGRGEPGGAGGGGGGFPAPPPPAPPPQGDQHRHDGHRPEDG